MTGPTAILYPAVRGLLFIALLLMIGGGVARRIVAEERAAAGRQWGDEVGARMRRLSWHLAWVLPALVIARGMLQVATFVDPDTPLSGDLVRGALTEGGWGHAWLLQVSAALLLLPFTWLRPRPVWEGVAFALVGVALWAQTGMGHPAGPAWPEPVGRIVDLTHIAGAGIWLGTLGVLAIGVFPVLTSHGRHPALHTTVRDFSTWARVGATLVIVSGTLAAWIYAGSIAAVFGSTWGRLLLFKLGFLLGVVMLGWWNWRVMTPALGRAVDHAPKWLRRAVRAELLLGLAMLGVTAWLVASPLPGGK